MANGCYYARRGQEPSTRFYGDWMPGTDACLHMLAKAAGATVNVVDRSPVVLAIGTQGKAPVLARQTKTRMEEMLEPRLGDLAALAGRLRDRAAARLQLRQRCDLWR